MGVLTLYRGYGEYLSGDWMVGTLNFGNVTSCETALALGRLKVTSLPYRDRQKDANGLREIFFPLLLFAGHSRVQLCKILTLLARLNA